jgi:hypothetical protein
MTVLFNVNNRLSRRPIDLYGVLNMIKRLFVTAFLLMPSLAYGASTSAPLSVEVLPAPVVPALARAVGSTTQVLNADFTSEAYSNLSTFVVNCGASNSVSGDPSGWHFYLNHTYTSGGTLPCSNLSITAYGFRSCFEN